MFDPYAKLVYDYMGGIQDIRKSKVRMYFHMVSVPNLVNAVQ